MLQWLRDNLKTFAWTLWLVIIAFILLYIPSFFEAEPDRANAYATVGDETVSRTRFLRLYQAEERRYREQLGDQVTPEFLRQFQLPMQVINRLINEEVLEAEAREMGLAVSDAELRKAILEIFSNPDGSFVGEDQYRRYLQSQGYARPADFENEVRSEMLRAKIGSVLAQNVFIPDADVERRYREQVERAAVRYMQLPYSQFASEVVVSDADVAAYYDEHRNEYRQPERRAISYLLVDRAKLQNEVAVTDDEVKAYYDSHKSDFEKEEQVRASHILLQADGDEEMAAAEARLNDLKRRIEAGEEFATLAREFSEDTGSAARGGDLQFFGRGAMVPAFEEAAFNAEVGELVGPVRSQFGVHLIKVTAKAEAGVTPLEEAAASIRFRLQNEKIEPAAERRARELAARIATEELTTDEQWQTLAADAESVSMQATQPFPSSGAIPTLGQIPELTTAIFEAEVGTAIAPIKAPRGWVVARVTEVLEPAIPELAEVESRVRGALQREREKEQAMARLRTAQTRISGGESFEAVATDLGLDVQQTEEFGRAQPAAELGTAGTAVAAAAFSMVEGEVGGPYPDAQGAVLVQVTERTQWDPSEFEENKESTRAELENAEVQRLLTALIERKKLELETSFTRAFLDDYEIDSAPGQG